MVVLDDRTAALIADLLELAASRFENDSCCDFPTPDLDEEERQTLARAVVSWAGGDERTPTNHELMDFFADVLDGGTDPFQRPFTTEAPS